MQPKQQRKRTRPPDIPAQPVLPSRMRRRLVRALACYGRARTGPGLGAPESRHNVGGPPVHSAGLSLKYRVFAESVCARRASVEYVRRSSGCADHWQRKPARTVARNGAGESSETANSARCTERPPAADCVCGGCCYEYVRASTWLGSLQAGGQPGRWRRVCLRVYRASRAGHAGSA